MDERKKKKIKMGGDGKSEKERGRVGGRHGMEGRIRNGKEKVKGKDKRELER